MEPVIDRLAITAQLDRSPAYRGTVHEDATARAQGFRGALIPGAFLIDYASRLALSRWGQAWLSAGTFAARFRRPVHHGDALLLRLGAAGGGQEPLTIDVEGTERVLEGALGLDATAPLVPEPHFEPHREPRPVMDPSRLQVGMRFGTASTLLSADDLAVSRAAMGQGDPAYGGGLAHLAALVRVAMGDVLRTFAWPAAPVFTAVEGRILGPVRAGQRLRTSAEVVETFERKGRHYFVSEEWLWADERPALMQRRTNLYAGASS